MSPRQCKAARALLGWKQDKLAVKAGISKRTVVRFESGEPATVEANRLLIQKTFEAMDCQLIAFGVVRASYFNAITTAENIDGAQ